MKASFFLQVKAIIKDTTKQKELSKVGTKHSCLCNSIVGSRGEFKNYLLELPFSFMFLLGTGNQWDTGLSP